MGRLALYRRFIDDILIVWKGGWDEVEDFMAHINDNQWGLSFTYKKHKSTIEFLDLTLIGTISSIVTKTFQKSVDVNGYLHAMSGHHPTWIQNIPLGQFTRIRRNCSYVSDYEKESLVLSRRFVEKSYPLNNILQAYLKGHNYGMESSSGVENGMVFGVNPPLLFLNPEHDHTKEHFRILELLNSSISSNKAKRAKFNISTKEVGTGRTPIFSTTFNKGYDDIIEILNKHWPILIKDPWLSFCVSGTPRVTFRRAPNLKNILAPSKLRSPTTLHQTTA
ncbi:Hypothetical predicted protein, partial [Pelobates cultripes]